MLLNSKNQIVHIDPKRKLTDDEKRLYREVKQPHPQSHKGDKFFSIEQRANLKG